MSLRLGHNNNNNNNNNNKIIIAFSRSLRTHPNLVSQDCERPALPIEISGLTRHDRINTMGGVIHSCSCFDE